MVFAQNGWDLVLAARSAEALRALAEELSRAYAVAAVPIVCDLSRADAPERLFRELSERSLSVEALVNNAGVGSFGHFSETPASSDEEMLAINVTALTKLTKLFVRPMVERGSGYVLNVASTAAFQPGPLMAVYYASKAYVLSFSAALANELEDKGVSVTVLCPGATATGFQRRAKMERSKLFKGHTMDARRVALAGYRGMMARKKTVVPGLKNKVLTLSTRLGPRSLAARVVRRLQELDKRALPLVLAALLAAAPAWAAHKTYTHPVLLYAVDYPEAWSVRQLGKAVSIAAPRESGADSFSENVQVVVEELGPAAPTLFEYHRAGIASAEKFLADFKPLEEARTEWLGRETVVMLYTATVRGERFRFKDYKFMAGTTAYVLTYTARDADFDSSLDAAESIMRSIRVGV